MLVSSLLLLHTSIIRNKRGERGGSMMFFMNKLMVLISPWGVFVFFCSFLYCISCGWSKSWEERRSWPFCFESYVGDLLQDKIKNQDFCCCGCQSGFTLPTGGCPHSHHPSHEPRSAVRGGVTVFDISQCNHLFPRRAHHTRICARLSVSFEGKSSGTVEEGRTAGA
ncbi:hypothetical protein B0T22DRAFT_91015 [Podospora appendiculata]|uniref:Uncharacterized protein n=1 Tax=Podospora appendiculata TaxID=314037 RepID=A0AAE1CHT9_9PEZI|nr:hypothetical protein B0T22DRAFT_91015 [Podospora appendiculata]